MPLVERACLCVAPLLFGHDGFLGLHGTCFAVEDERTTVFLAARHSLKGTQENTSINIPISLGPGATVAVIERILGPSLNRDQFPPSEDFAVLLPKTRPVSAEDQFQPIRLDRCANLDRVRTSALFAVAGHPKGFPDGNQIDYESREITLGIHFGIGKYVGPSKEQVGCHVLSLDTNDIEGPGGLSGAPVFRILRRHEQWVPLWAGIVITGNASMVQFIDVKYPLEYLLRKRVLKIKAA